MEFYQPPTGLGALMPQDDFGPMIDWTYTNPYLSIEPSRPRQADGGAQEYEQCIWGQTPTNTQPQSLDTISEPWRISLDQPRAADTLAPHSAIEKTAAPDSRSGDDDDDDAATTTTTTTHISLSSSSSSPAPARPTSASPEEGPAPPPPTRRRRRRRSSAATGPSTEAARAKNRIAATKCRRKKKVEERELEERQRRLHLQRAVLQDAANALVHEILALKHEVLRHAACGFAPLDRYITEAARRGSVASSSSNASWSPPTFKSWVPEDVNDR